MYALHLSDPIKTIKKLARLRDDDLITIEEFRRAKTVLLKQAGDDS